MRLEKKVIWYERKKKVLKEFNLDIGLKRKINNPYLGVITNWSLCIIYVIVVLPFLLVLLPLITERKVFFEEIKDGKRDKQ